MGVGSSEGSPLGRVCRSSGVLQRSAETAVVVCNEGAQWHTKLPGLRHRARVPGVHGRKIAVRLMALIEAGPGQ
eukprot:1749558-Rhodomonas_salina.1